jgi:hypothetical protein
VALGGFGETIGETRYPAVTETYRIVCVDLAKPSRHEHILTVGMGADPDRADAKWAVEQVRAAIRNGDHFYTESLSTGDEAEVEPYDCGCGVKTIRSTADAVTDNNLDNLRPCRWQN